MTKKNKDVRFLFGCVLRENKYRGFMPNMFCILTRHGKRTRTRGYPSELVPILTGKIRFDWVWVFPDFKGWGWGG